MTARLLLVGCAVLVVACGEPGDPRAPERAARVAAAEAEYSPALFDTVAWDSEQERAVVGDLAYATHCRNCHGPTGQGATEYAEHHGIEVPSLVEPGWANDGDVAAVRRRIFTGHPAGMPSWGITGLSVREIDAIAHFIVDRLRPEAVGGGAALDTARQP